VHAFTVGFGLGFFVALQLGPISLYLIRSTLRAGLAVGLAIAVAVAVIDLLYAALGAAGAAPLLAIRPLEIVLGVLGAAVLVFLGVRTLRSAFRIRLGTDDGEALTPKRAFVTALSATASNPLTIASWAAIFSAASAAGAADSVGAAALLVAGAALSLAWAGAIALTRSIAIAVPGGVVLGGAAGNLLSFALWPSLPGVPDAIVVGRVAFSVGDVAVIGGLLMLLPAALVFAVRNRARLFEPI
jgi:putative LysE/RhtB family amino acid efflux pump